MPLPRRGGSVAGAEYSERLTAPTRPDERLIDLALSPPRASPGVLTCELAALDPDDIGFEGWQALMFLQPLLDPESMWAGRVASMRRRSLDSAPPAATTAAQISAALRSVGIPHAVFGDLALATAYGLPPGTRALNYLSLWTDPAAPRDELLAALAGVPELRSPRGGGRVLRASVGQLAIGIHRGWPREMGRQQGPLATPAMSTVQSISGPFPVVGPGIEAYHAMLATRRSSVAAWLLDLQTIAVASPAIWGALPFLAKAGERSSTLRAAWEEAHDRHAAPAPPKLAIDPLWARISQKLEGPSGAVRGRLVPLIGEAAARPDHGPWPALYDVALGLARIYVGARITRIDEGGEAALAGAAPLILAANHLGHLDYDTILITTPRRRRRRLRYVASEQVLALFGSGHGVVGRGRAAVLRGVYTHIHRVIPVREHIRGQAAVAAMTDALAAGDTVVIFPEGRHNRGEGLDRLKPGVAMLARESGAPILPIRIDGTRGKVPARHGILIRTKPSLTVRYRPTIQVAAGDSDEDILSRLAAGLAEPESTGDR